MSNRTFAQGSAAIAGTVTDPTGAAVPSCSVTATQAGTGFSRSASCGTEGYYIVPSLAPARYTLSITAVGFSTFTQAEFTLLANQSLTINAKLELGATSQQVTVEATPTQVDTTTPTLKEVIDQARIAELPLNGRNAATLTALVAGAVAAPDGRATQGLTTPVNVTISVNGARQNQISYQLDGGNNTDELTNVNAPFPFPDALQEFSVQTSNYSAEFGQNSGAVVNIVTKSGTNQYHGNAFGFVRNAVFNARNFFEGGRDQLKRSQFGGTLGGPVLLPGYNGKEKTFFFFGYQGTRISNIQGTDSAVVPLAANLNGDFSSLLSAGHPSNTMGRVVQVTDPLNGQPFSGNMIPVARYDRAAVNAMKYLPQASSPTGLVFYSQPFQQRYDDIVLRVDHKISDKDQLTGRYFRNKYTKVGSYADNNLLTLAAQRNIPMQNVLLHETHVFRPNLLNDARFAFIRIHGGSGPPSGVPSLSDLGVKLKQDPKPGTISEVYIEGFFAIGAAWPVIWARNSFEFSDDVHWIRGRHDISFGARVERAVFDNTNTYQQRPDIYFSGDATGYAPADFFLGRMRQFTQSAGQFLNVRTTRLGVYVQDRIRVTPRLTVDAGVRYEPFLPWHETEGRVMRFSPQAYYSGVKSKMFVNAPAGLSFPGDSGFPKNGLLGDFNNFAPRLGFAWDVLGTGKTSVRGGVGMFYESRQVMVSNIPFITNPFTFQVSLTDPQGPFSNPYQGISDPFPAPRPSPDAYFPSPTNAFTYNPGSDKYVTPVAYNWNLSVEQQLAAQWVLRLAYAGSHSSHGFEVLNLNPAVYIPGSSASVNARRLFKGYSTISNLTQDTNSSYNSLQATVTKRMSHGFTLLANYTWSKSIDNQPSGAAVNSALVSGVYPWYFPNSKMMDRGPSEWDRTHVFVTSYVWKIAGPKSDSKAVNAVLDGWQLTGIISAQSGRPFTVRAGTDRSKTALGADRGVLLGAPYGSGACRNEAPCRDYLNISSFGLPEVGTFGNIGKNSLRGPNLFNLDFGLFKNFQITERVELQLRSEFFNFTNHVNFDTPSSSVTSGSFGRILGTATGSRIGQFGLKIQF